MTCLRHTEAIAEIILYKITCVQKEATETDKQKSRRQLDWNEPCTYVQPLLLCCIDRIYHELMKIDAFP